MHSATPLCEHIDNAIQAGASEIRVYIHQSGKRGDYHINGAVYDNGQGMAPTVLKVAMAFGGSTSFGNRTGIGRFGMTIRDHRWHGTPQGWAEYAAADPKLAQ